MKISLINNYNFTSKPANATTKEKVVADGNVERQIDGFYIDKYGYLTKTPEQERSKGYYILCEGESQVFMLPDGSLVFPDNKEPKPVLAKDILTEKNKNIQEQNKSIGVQISGIDTQINQLKANAAAVVKDIEGKSEKLRVYYWELNAIAEKLKNISKDELRTFCDNIAEFVNHTYYYDNVGQIWPNSDLGYIAGLTFFREPVGMLLCRTSVPTKIEDSVLKKEGKNANK